MFNYMMFIKGAGIGLAISLSVILSGGSLGIIPLLVGSILGGLAYTFIR